MSVFQLIKEVQKKFRARESEKKELEVCGMGRRVYIQRQGNENWREGEGKHVVAVKGVESPFVCAIALSGVCPCMV